MIVTLRSAIALVNASKSVSSFVRPSVNTTKTFTSPDLSPLAWVNIISFAASSARSRKVGDLSLSMVVFMRPITSFTDQKSGSLNLLWTVALLWKVSRDTCVLSSEISNFWTRSVSASLRTATFSLPRLLVVSITRPRSGLQMETGKKNKDLFSDKDV